MGVTHRRVLPCSDFPRPGPLSPDRGRLTAFARDHSKHAVPEFGSIRHMAPAKPTTPKRVICWLDTAQAPLVREVAAAANIKIVGAGSPTRAQSGAVATELSTEPVDDLRVALTDAHADAVFIAALGDFGRSDAASDAPALLAARARGVEVISLEPFPVSAIDLATRGWLDIGQGIRPADATRLVPLPRNARSFRDATEVLAILGEVRSVAIEALGSVVHGSLAARLIAALDTVALLMGEPESIDAVYCSPAKTPGLHALPGETLANLHGDMAISLRFSGGRAATILASDHAGAWSFTCTAIGTGGRLRLHDHGFDLFAHDGARVDEAVHRRPSKAAPSLAAAAIADAISRTLDPQIPDAGPMDWAGVLSMAQAALLSSRTGQGESPATFRSMMGLAIT